MLDGDAAPSSRETKCRKGTKKKVTVCAGIVAMAVPLIFIQKTRESFQLMHLVAEDFLSNFPYIQDRLRVDPSLEGVIQAQEPYRTCFLTSLCSALILGMISVDSFVYAGILFLKGGESGLNETG